MFFKVEVYRSYALEDLAKVRQALATASIRYTYKVVNLSTDWSGHRSRNNFGSFGTNTNVERQYVVFVGRKDEEEANYIIRRALNG
ncbi:hypothetical protein [Lysinibacillus piscis]|uniref:Uncharacterized protein n=1 Tax=Lysinibacillus piscis TaxID=2518931 RepID=A0ABQ5NMZ8_9BACI|nr:hypothetical protein [Lysinibacillus sp. KH24]GLC89730.1 hypothetical protein LYSBPC_28570 [Lysinibacillus sp. KH24]